MSAGHGAVFASNFLITAWCSSGFRCFIAGNEKRHWLLAVRFSVNYDGHYVKLAANTVSLISIRLNRGAGHSENWKNQRRAIQCAARVFRRTTWKPFIISKSTWFTCCNEYERVLSSQHTLKFDARVWCVARKNPLANRQPLFSPRPTCSGQNCIYEIWPCLTRASAKQQTECLNMDVGSLMAKSIDRFTSRARARRAFHSSHIRPIRYMIGVKNLYKWLPLDSISWTLSFAVSTILFALTISFLRSIWLCEKMHDEAFVGTCKHV